MKLWNPLKSINWTSLFQSSRNRRQRGRKALMASQAAEVLEVRALLTASNVTAVLTGGTALTLTSDNTGDHGVDVYRKDATHIEIDGHLGTTINGSASVVLSNTL